MSTIQNWHNMSTPTDGGTAFPGYEHFFLPDQKVITGQPYGGMSLRDWFAGQALAAMTAAPDYSKGPCNAAMAERAYIIADAMLAERAKGADHE